MCLACEEMDMYAAYLARREAPKDQPWECQVTLFPPSDEATAVAMPDVVAPAKATDRPAE